MDYDEHFVDYGDEPEQPEEELVALNLSISDGHGILDGGATKTAGGIAQLESLRQCYLGAGCEFDIGKSNVELTIADGERQPAGSLATLAVPPLDMAKISTASRRQHPSCWG